MMTTATGRDHSLDLLAGVFIVYMIFTHLCQESGLSQSLVYEWLDNVLWIFMPWFFMKSGMYHKQSPEILCGLKKHFNRLGLPLLVFSLASIPVFTIYVLQTDPYEGHSFIYSFLRASLCTLLWDASPFGNSPLWFLISLFSVKCLLVFVHNEKSLSLLMGLSLLAAFILNYLQLNHYRLINVPITGMFFYILGYKIRSIQYNRIAAVSASFIFFISIIFSLSHLSIRSNETYGGGYFEAVAFAVCGVIFYNNFSKALFRIGSFSKLFITSIFVKLGKVSMYFFAIHWIYMKLISFALTNLGFDLRLLFVLLPIVLIASYKLHFLRRYT